ncbi:hypothetical protein A2U01_0075949, partial [Trifolium medium]|nr:hypothetical protein [Trifolium medium]
MSSGCKNEQKSTLCTVPARGAALPGTARKRQFQNLASKQTWRAAQHPWARRAPTSSNQNTKIMHFELAMAPLSLFPP